MLFDSFGILVIIFWFGPIVFVLIDKNTLGREKTGWAILTLFVGILALPFYLIKTKNSN